MPPPRNGRPCAEWRSLRRNRHAEVGLVEVMKCLRVYADEEGESHFSEMVIAMSESQLIPDHTIQRSSGGGAYPVPNVTGWRIYIASRTGTAIRDLVVGDAGSDKDISGAACARTDFASW